MEKVLVEPLPVNAGEEVVVVLAETSKNKVNVVVVADSFDEVIEIYNVFAVRKTVAKLVANFVSNIVPTVDDVFFNVENRSSVMVSNTT